LSAIAELTEEQRYWPKMRPERSRPAADATREANAAVVHRTLLMTLYATGVRRAELTH
jgi:integrase